MKRLAGLLAVLWAAGCGGDEFGQARAEASGGAQAGAAAASVGQVGGEATVSVAGSGGTVRPYGGQAGSVETGGAPGPGAGGRPGGSGGAPGPGGTPSSGGEGGGIEGGAPGVGGTGAGATGGIRAGGLPGVGGETVGGAPALGGLVEPGSGGEVVHVGGIAGAGGETIGGQAGTAGAGGTPAEGGCLQLSDLAEFCPAEPRPYAWRCNASPPADCEAATVADVWCCGEACAPISVETYGWRCSDPQLPEPWGCYAPFPEVRTPTGCDSAVGVNVIVCCPEGARY